MGPAKDKRVLANGETLLWYPRQPSGAVSYAARIGKDDRLIAIEQRLTRENLDQLSRASRETATCSTCSARPSASIRIRACSATPGPGTPKASNRN